VAIALEKAVINNNPASVDYLMQNLDNVYTNPDPRAYPLSSYSYLIVPRNSRPGATQGSRGFPANKGKSLSTYVNYILCEAQQTAGQLGYSPLPEPMVVGGFLQDGHIPGAVGSQAAHNYSSCNNPAYKNGKDVLTATAPYPNACQKATAPLNCTLGRKPNSPGGSGPGGPSGPGNSNGHTTGPSSPGSHNPAAAGPSSGPSYNPNTGQLVSGSSPGATNVNAQPVAFAGQPQEEWTFGGLTALVLIAVVAVPTLLGTWLSRRRGTPRPGGPTDPASSVTDI
jgi:hypothetical protein